MDRNIFYSSLYFLFFSLSCSFVATGQVWTISETMRLERNGYYKILGKSDNDYKMVKVYPDAVDLFTFDNNLKPRHYRPIDIFQEQQNIHRVFEGENSFDILYSIVRQDSVILVLSRYNYNGDIQRVRIVKQYDAKEPRPDFNAILSDNNEWLALSNMRLPGLFEIIVLNMVNMHVYRDDVFGLSAFDLGGFPPDIFITDSGRTFILVESREEVNQRPKQFMSVIQMFMDDRDTKVVEMEFGNAIVDYPYYYWDEKNSKLNIFGFFRSAFEFETRGIFHVNIEESFESSPDINLIPFSSALLQQYFEKTRHPIPGIPDLQMVNLVMEENGDYLLFAEVRTKFYREQDAYNPFTRTTSSYVDYFYDEIIVFRLGSDGEVKWHRMLDKQHRSSDDNAVHASFITVDLGNRYRLIHNEHTRRNSKVMEYIVTATGDIEKNTLYEVRRHPLRLHITTAVKISKNEILIPSVNRRDVHIVRLELKDLP